MSPWLPVWLSPFLLLLLAVVGWPWSLLALAPSTGSGRVALSPVFGLGALASGALLADAIGFRLGGTGGWIALALAGSGWPLLALRARTGAARPAAR